MPGSSKNEPTEDPTHDEAYFLTRKMLLAALGAAALAHDEISSLLDQLSERGELAEKDLHKIMGEIIERRSKIIEERRAEFQRRHPHTATKTEVEELKAKIAELNKKIEELKKS